MKLQNALNYLNHLIRNGAEFPDAFDRTCSKFRLEPEEWDDLKIMYDAEEN